MLPKVLPSPLAPSLLAFAVLAQAATLRAQAPTAHVLRLGVDSLQYALYVPRVAPAPGEARPLVMYLHGGAGGTDVGHVMGDPSGRNVHAHAGDSAYVVAPLNRFERGFWDLRALDYLLDSLSAKLPLDTTRLYLTGSSRGGLGAWTLAMQYPERFAALVPVCGAVPHPYHVWVPDDLPLWIFHGTDDNAIPTSETFAMLDLLRNRRERTADTRVTVYEGVGHEAWEHAYREEELYAWLLRQRR